MTDNNVIDEFPQLNDKSQTERVKDFGELLATIENIDDKMKQLWKEIYENAINDRAIAYVMFVKLAQISQDKSNEHAVHARSMANFVERMSKANDQLLKLADLISRSDPANKPIDQNEIFDAIKKR
jgi:hypothetical protein